jgi:glycosyltransferase involved in cell wall biosynthesis
MPANVEVLPAVDDPAELYAQGDVCLQPSYWEGLGLPLLESQACGLPLVTTAGSPMNEARPYRSIGCTPVRVEIGPRHQIEAHVSDPMELARIMGELFETDVSTASADARTYVERCHSWPAAIRSIERAMKRVLAARPVFRF